MEILLHFFLGRTAVTVNCPQVLLLANIQARYRLSAKGHTTWRYYLPDDRRSCQYCHLGLQSCSNMSRDCCCRVWHLFLDHNIGNLNLTFRKGGVRRHPLRRLIDALQKRRRLRMQNMDIMLTSRDAMGSLMSFALLPDFKKNLWKVAISQRKPYQSNFYSHAFSI